ncbi:phosphoribosylanthranilate isomerase [Virgibacillus kekensis]|uniref:N-(5'-phosphoribosyl)anthranilate isomerase n=1 Tax=Virgibacillus kekensis TaxID=202261 RepID=A0ABV9DPJ3_9BACI
MLVKICGITTKEAAREAVTAGADFIGFVFARSKRKIDPEDVRQIVSTLPPSVKKVGVFVNESRDKIVQIADQAGLDYIQLHGDEPADFAESLPYPVIKAFSIEKTEISAINSYPCDYYLIDSPAGKYRGGNGTTFDWTLLKESRIDREKVILAGGLNPQNIHEAITTARPAGVDVSSGVETDGYKDLLKIKQFITNAKG